MLGKGSRTVYLMLEKSRVKSTTKKDKNTQNETKHSTESGSEKAYSLLKKIKILTLNRSKCPEKDTKKC